MKAEFKLIVKPSLRDPYYSARILPIKSKAKIEDAEIAIDMKLVIPDSLFLKPTLKAEITVTDPGREVSSSVAAAIRDLVEDKFNVEVKIIK